MPRLIAASILAGCALIAAAIYFGLRARPVGVAAPSSPPTAPASDERALASQVKAQLQAARPELAEACWPAGTPGSATYQLDLTFAADGAQIARGILGDRRVRAPGVEQCAQQKLPPLHVAPPGATVHLEVPLELP